MKAIAGAVVAGAALFAVQAVAAAPRTPESIRFPAVGELLVPAAVVRARPSLSARKLRTIRQQRPNGQLQTLLAIRSLRHAGLEWYELSLSGRPNGQRGWIDAGLLDVEPARVRIVVHRAARTIEVRTIPGGKLLARGVVAIGKPSSPTPLGRDYYVVQGYRPTDPFYGTYALATSAYSRLTDWPGGGVVGIHGTNRPELLGQAVSHGCIRVSNRTADRLARLAPPGTPIDILP
jgi:hypothetical protein